MANIRLQGKTVVITGASSGIGAEMALQCAKAGANVVLLARSVDKLLQLKDKIVSLYSVEVFVYELDVSKTDMIETVFQQILTDVKKIDVLVNNAGFGVFREAFDAPMDEVKGMFDVNVIGLMACTKMVLAPMKQQKSGHIINIASQAGKIATPKSSVYSATKHAVLGYSNSLRMELADEGVFVTTINPGPIATNFFTIADEKGTYVKNIERYMLGSEEVATKVVSIMLTNTREINLPKWMNAGSIVYTLFPRMFERIGKKAFMKK